MIAYNRLQDVYPPLVSPSLQRGRFVFYLTVLRLIAQLGRR